MPYHVLQLVAPLPDSIELSGDFDGHFQLKLTNCRLTMAFPNWIAGSDCPDTFSVTERVRLFKADSVIYCRINRRIGTLRVQSNQITGIQMSVWVSDS